MNFCPGCGARLLRVCSNCGGSTPAHESICGKCGALLGAADGSTKLTEDIDSERKHVTVLFSDISGYTAMTERLDPEEVKEIMSRVFGDIAQIIAKYEGFIERFVGDAVMAIFGVPKVHEDDPVRAIRAAKDIHDPVAAMSPRYEDRLGQPLAVHSGINSGLVVTGAVNMEKGIHGITGETINVAARLQSLAKAGEILVGQDTYRQALHQFTFHRMKPTKIKGKVEPISVYKLTDPQKPFEDCFDRSRLGSERQIHSVIVGRKHELAKLELQVMKVTNGLGSIVNIIGEAGVGKSRLMAELKDREVMEHVTLLEGRAISIGRNLSFHPLIDILKHWARIGKSESEASAFNKLESAVSSVFDEQSYEVFPFIATLMGMKLYGKYAERVKGIKGEALEKLILKNMRELFIKSSEMAPLVIVSEDLQWADTSSIELLELLFRLAETHRILFINVFRPDHPETGDRIVSTIQKSLSGIYVEVLLQPLNGQKSLELIKNVLNIGELPHEVSNKIVERTGGNPFFIEEVVQSFIDEGAVVPKNGSFAVTGMIDTVVIPQSVFDVLMARIDRLERQTRNLIKVAAVIGRNFFYRILADVVESIEDIDTRLVYLKEIQLIEERKGPREVKYQFKHALTQEVAYKSLLHEKRRELHLKVADSIENIFPERLTEFYGMLAYHYGRAEDLEKTEYYLIKAGEEALRTSASSEALNYYREGLKLYLEKYGEAADPEKVTAFKKNIAIALFNKGKHENAITYFDSVLDHWGAGSPNHRIALRIQQIRHLLSLVGHLYLPFREATKIPSQIDNDIISLSYKKSMALVHVDPERCFTEFISTIKRLNRFNIEKVDNGVGIRISASGLFSWSGVSFALSKKILECNKHFVRKDDSKQILYYDFFELLHNAFRGNWSDIKEFDEDLVTQNLRVGETWHAVNYLLVHGHVKTDRGDFEGAKTIIGQVDGIWKVYGNENALAAKQYVELRLLVVRRKLLDAQRLADDAFRRSETHRPAVLYYLGYNAIVHILLNNPTAAKALLLQAKTTGYRKDLPPIYVSSYIVGQFFFDLTMLERALNAENNEEILKYRERARTSGKSALRNAGKYAFNKTEVLRLKGLHHWVLGRQKKAATFWGKSINEGERLGARVELARTYAEVGRRLREPNSRISQLNGRTADEYVEQARSLFEEMDLRWDLNGPSRIVMNG